MTIAVTAYLLWAGLFAGPRFNACLPAQQDQARPFTWVREYFAGVDPSEIEALCFWGDELDRDSSDPLCVKDRALIARFVIALRHGTSRPVGVLDHVNNMQVRFLPGHTSRRPPIQSFDMSFESTNSLDCFGTEFQSLLGKPLASAFVADLRCRRREKMIHVFRVCALLDTRHPPE